MLTRYSITFDGVERDLGNGRDSIKNWADIACTFRRSDYSGVMRSFSSEFEFVGDIAEELKELYLRDGIEAKAVVKVSTSNDNWHYTTAFTSSLDFSTIKWGRNVVTMSCVDNSLAAMIKSRKSTKYELTIGDDLPVANHLAYDRVMMLNTVTHTVTGANSNDDGSVMMKVYHTDGSSVRFVPTYICGDLETYENNPLIADDESADGESYMFEAARDVPSLNMYIEVQFDSTNLNTKDDGSGNDIPLDELRLALCKQSLDDDGNYPTDEDGKNVCTEICEIFALSKFQYGGTIPRVEFGRYESYEALMAASEEYIATNGRLPQNALAVVVGNGGENQYYITHVPMQGAITSYKPQWWLVDNNHTYKVILETDLDGIRNGDRIFVGVDAAINDFGTQWLEHIGATYNLYYPIRCKIVSSWTSRAEMVVIDTLSPLDVAKALVDKVADGKVDASVQISDYDARIARTRLMAAESIRGISNAKFYSSFNDYCNWMETVFGYTYRIDGSDDAPVLTFAHRSELFAAEADVVPYDDEAVDVEYSVDSSILYSSIEIGYSKVDYGKVCGRDEWNFLSEYTTGTEVGEKKLSLKSPYRADCYGIEFLAQERSSDTKDDESDSDTFFVLCNAAANTAGLLTIDRSTSPVLGAFSQTVFNGAFSPYHCLRANEGFICAMASPLQVKYASNTGNSSVRVFYDGAYVNLQSDVTLQGRIFTAGVLSFTTAMAFEDIEGLIGVESNGLIYTGYLDEVDMKFAREEAFSYKIIIKSIE